MQPAEGLGFKLHPTTSVEPRMQLRLALTQAASDLHQLGPLQAILGTNLQNSAWEEIYDMEPSIVTLSQPMACMLISLPDQSLVINH